MIHPTLTQTLLTTTFEPLVMQLSSSVARGARIINQFVQAAPTPEATMAFELELDTLLRGVGRRIMAWTLNQVEPEADAEAPARLEYNGYLYRRRRQPPRSVAPLFGPVTLRRRLYERLGRSGSGRSVHPLELGLGLEAGLATPALAERVGRLATEHSQQEVREMLQSDYGVHWSCTSVLHLCAQSPRESAGRDGSTPRGRPDRPTPELAGAGPCVHGPLSTHPVGWA